MMTFVILVLLLSACAIYVTHREGYRATGWMTHYAGSEADKGHGTGTTGYMGTRLRANKSIAVKQSKWKSMGCRRVKIGGKTYVVDNVCRGPTCRDLDLYLGDRVSESQINKRGVKRVTYDVGTKDSACIKKCKWNCPR